MCPRCMRMKQEMAAKHAAPAKLLMANGVYTTGGEHFAEFRRSAMSIACRFQTSRSKEPVVRCERLSDRHCRIPCGLSGCSRALTSIPSRCSSHESIRLRRSIFPGSDLSLYASVLRPKPLHRRILQGSRSWVSAQDSIWSVAGDKEQQSDSRVDRRAERPA